MRRVTLLLDSDIVAYKYAYSYQEEFRWANGVTSVSTAPVEDAARDMVMWINQLMIELNADDLIVCLSSPSAEGFRKQLYPRYKANRAGAARPALLGPLRDYLEDNYRSFKRDTLEADDVMGILATHPKLISGEKIIVSIDKDMASIPGKWYNPDTDRLLEVSLEEADRFHLFQTLTGDPVDNYPGCPGIGPVKATALLSGKSGMEAWEAVVGAYEKKGLTEEDALIQARMARILRHTDYDFRNREVILWEPKMDRQSP
jgi:DNA polymerase-1